MFKHASRRRGLVALATLGLVSSPLALGIYSPASANTAGTGLVISEVYGGGGNTGAPYTNDFIELYNPTGAAIPVAGLSVQYRSATGNTAALTNLTTGSVPAGGYFLIQESAGATPSTALPTPDATGTLTMSGTAGVVILASNQTAVTAVGNFAGAGAPANVIDTVGYGTTPTTFETTNTATALTNTTSAQRAANGADTDANNPDFTEATPTPVNAAAGGGPVTPTALAVTSPGDKTATTGTAITPFTVTATGGTSPYTYSATGLPAGLSISSAGQVTGTPTAAGASSVTVTATDSATPTPATATTTFTITVSDPGAVTPIATIQGTTDTSPQVGNTVTTAGVVTSIYSPGTTSAGFTIETGGPTSTPNASDAIQVFTGANVATASLPAIGSTVAVTGVVSEFNGLTEITAANASAIASAPAQAAVVANTVLPGTDCVQGSCPTTADINTAREAHESETYQPTGSYTVTDPYDGSPSPSTSSANFGEIGLAAEMSTPLTAATEDYDAQTQAAQITARNAYNTAHEINIDDASSINYTTAANTGLPIPWFTKTYDVRVGAAVTFPTPVVLTYGNSEWRYETQTQVVGDPGNLVNFAQTRTTYAGGPAAVGGNIKLATANVLNYFPTTGQEFVSSGLGSCTYYNDRAGNPVTDNTCGTATSPGPRGAATTADLTRQQSKIVREINSLGADVVSLEEIENSIWFNKDRDFGVMTLVNALNADAGAGTWSYAPSPAAADLPAKADQDVIRTAFIYKPATVSLVGASQVLTNSAPFGNAREPLAQAFKAKGAPDSSAFGVIVNHFKSKGSGTDDGTGQGNANPDRVNQANALLEFAAGFKASRSITKMFLVGDFNAYGSEDPVQKIEAGTYTPAAGGAAVNGDVYTPINDTKAPIDKSYSFGGQNGSLDHIFANDAANATVTGADVWAINAFESVYYEYSRFNYNVTDLFDGTVPFRASDHNPEIVGINAPTTTPPVTLNLLNINDFHGRIDSAITPQFATKIEQLRAAGGENNTLLLSAGDNIGASLFASANQQDNPTIDVLNALNLNSSAVGNHEFDQGFADLTGRVQSRATWTYLGANVYNADGSAALPAYQVFTVNGVKVGVIGAVTQETPSLVSPAGIQGLTFGDPVDAVNRVATQLSDGNAANGEADVIVAEYHEGAPNGDVENATLGSNLAASAVFSKIVNGTSPAVDAIFTGHTHKKYAYSAPVTGGDVANRPVVQTGNYGDFVGHVTLTYSPDTGKVTANTQENVARGTTTDLSYPRVQQVKNITDAAVAAAATQGNVPVGTITADITTAFTGGTYTNGVYAGGTRDDRASESTLGDLVGNVLRDEVTVFNPGAATPDLGIVNPGGLRAELTYAANTASNPQNTAGVVTYAEANSVLPFSNNVYLVKLTGAQLKAVLEQQYQTNADGSVPTRSYLQLGLSDNVNVTTDPTLAAGSRITSVYVSGQPLDMAKTYTVSTFSFLATGGDNFRAFTGGTSSDTGLLDANLFRDYFQKHPGIAPDFARQQVTESGKPAVITAGVQSAFTLSKLDLTSQGSPLNTQLVATIGGSTVGTYPVTNGTAAVDLTVPLSYTTDGQVVFTATPSGTKVTVPFKGYVAPAQATTVTGTAAPIAYGQAGSVQVTVSSATGTPTGSVTLTDGTTVVGTATLTNGTATITVPAGLSLGTHTLGLAYTPDDTTKFTASTGTVDVTVTQATPTVTATATPSTITVGTGTSSIHVTVAATGYTPTGTVEIVDAAGTSLGTGTLANGAANVTVGPFTSVGTKTLTVRYSGDANTVAATGSTSLTVAKATATITATATPSRVTVNQGTSTIGIVVGSDGAAKPTGTVTVSFGAAVQGTATLVNGAASIKVGPFKGVKAYDLTVSYAGDDVTGAATKQVTVTTVKQTPKVTVVGPAKVKQGGTPKYTVRVASPGVTVTGQVTITYRGNTTTKPLTSGAAVFTLKKLTGVGSFKLTARYLGNATQAIASGSKTVTVVKK